eukprot:Nk52_evm10s282 gene=Nk52_evmTU10s282
MPSLSLSENTNTTSTSPDRKSPAAPTGGRTRTARDRSSRRAAASVQSLLNEDQIISCLLEECGVLDRDVARSHADRILQKVYQHEKGAPSKSGKMSTMGKSNSSSRRSSNSIGNGGKSQKEEEEEEKEEMKKKKNNSSGIQSHKAAAVTEFDIRSISDLPKLAYTAMGDWPVLTSRVVLISESGDYVTTKLLIRLRSGDEVECVLLRHLKRTTLCVSSQVGCMMACSFCATGTLGQRANLTSGEIIEQLIHANRFLREKNEPRLVTNVVFMGMGEPLNNYDSLVGACRALTRRDRYSMAAGRVTVSTVGVVNRMKSLYSDVPGISLALSLHAPNQALREFIIPTAKAYPIPKMMAALRGYLDQRQADTGKDSYVMIEYILLSGVNDMPEIAHELGALLNEHIPGQVKLNLIPYNPIFNPEGLAKTFVPPTEEDIETFQRILQTEHNVFCTVRTEMGQDVNGACGQLACVSEEARLKEQQDDGNSSTHNNNGEEDEDDQNGAGDYMGAVSSVLNSSSACGGTGGSEGGSPGVMDIEDLYLNRKYNELYNEKKKKKVTDSSAVVHGRGGKAKVALKKKQPLPAFIEPKVVEPFKNGDNDTPVTEKVRDNGSKGQEVSYSGPSYSSQTKGDMQLTMDWRVVFVPVLVALLVWILFFRTKTEYIIV